MSTITVELQRVPEGESEYRTVATLQVDAAGTHTLEDPDELFPLEIPVLVAGEPGQPPRRIAFNDDPAAWAANLSSLLRTGYLVPVVTIGDDQNISS